LNAITYSILTRVLIADHGQNSTLAIAVGQDFKGKVSVLIDVIAILFALMNLLIACGLYVLVAVMWLVPDRRIEKKLTP
jgi:uncharacterized membrane protein